MRTILIEVPPPRSPDELSSALELQRRAAEAYLSPSWKQLERHFETREHNSAAMALWRCFQRAQKVQERYFWAMVACYWLTEARPLQEALQEAHNDLSRLLGALGPLSGGRPGVRLV